jgi:hypothetical protein
LLRTGAGDTILSFLRNCAYFFLANYRTKTSVLYDQQYDEISDENISKKRIDINPFY